MKAARKYLERLLSTTILFSTCLFSFHLPTTPPDTAETSEAATLERNLPPTDDIVRERSGLLERLGVTAWHRQGQRGQGVKVAILDSGFRGYLAHLGHALPAHVLARSFRSDGCLEAKDSQHGILCAEVVHALAPDAELMFANWEPDRPDQFLDAVRWARQEGARVLTCSVIMPSWSDGEGHGEIHRELTRLLTPGGVLPDMLCFASAGNTAQRHWSGIFHDSGSGWHSWTDNKAIDNAIRPWGNGESVSVELCTAPESNFELVVQDMTTGREVGRNIVHRTKSSAIVRFAPQENHDYTLRVRQRQSSSRFFHLVVLGGGLQYATAHGSIPFPGDGPEIIAVGAVDTEGNRLDYSSCGPNSERPKPDFVASVPFPSLWRSRPFAGTSAAAPQAAGLAALLFARHHDWTALQVRRSLEAAAEDLGPPGHDCETGFGRIHLP